MSGIWSSLRIIWVPKRLGYFTSVVPVCTDSLSHKLRFAQFASAAGFGRCSRFPAAPISCGFCMQLRFHVLQCLFLACFEVPSPWNTASILSFSSWPHNLGSFVSSKPVPGRRQVHCQAWLPALASLDHRFSMLILRKYYSEAFISVMMIPFIIANFSLSFNQHWFC